MNKILKMFYTILIDQRAEGEGAGAGAGAGDGGAGGGSAPAKGGQGGAPGAGEGGQGGDGGEGAGEGSGAGEGQGGEGEGGQGQGDAPKYGKYKTPDELWKAHQDLTVKTTQTQQNADKLRKTLDSAGIKVAQDAQGNLILVPAEGGKKERTKKFSDDQKKKLALYFGDDPEKGNESASGFLGLMQSFFEDMLEDQFSSREEAFNQRNSQVSQFRQTQESANTRMLRMFPQLKYGSEENPNAEFNEAFYNRATEIWQQTYPRDPRGELLAALDAADELGIVANAIKQAKQEGVKFGQQGKKILGPVGGGQGKGGGSGKQLSKAEYMALTPEKRDEYDRAQLQVAR